MDAIPISRFAEIAKVSDTSLRNYVRPFREALKALRQSGYSYNYKVVLFLCYVLVYDVAKFYPDEDINMILNEQKQIVEYVNETLNCKY